MVRKAESKTGSRKPSRFGRHPHVGYTTQASVWIEKDGELYLGGGRVMLLERLEHLGSIAAAASVGGPVLEYTADYQLPATYVRYESG